MTELKTYHAHEHERSISSSSGFTNHWHGTADDIARALAAVFADHPDAVVVDGNDDWFAPKADRPLTWRDAFTVEPLAWFHSGTSGITVSGIVLARGDFERVEQEFPAVMGTPLRGRSKLRIYERR